MEKVYLWNDDGKKTWFHVGLSYLTVLQTHGIPESGHILDDSVHITAHISILKNIALMKIKDHYFLLWVKSMSYRKLIT